MFLKQMCPLPSGHYVCDGAYSLRGQETDCWMTYNDSEVVKTSCQAVCKQRQRLAYLLFYEKKISTWHHSFNFFKSLSSSGSWVDGAFLRPTIVSKMWVKMCKYSEKGCTVAQRLALLPHREVTSSFWTWPFCVEFTCSPVHAWVFSGSSGFLPLIKICAH